MSATDPRPPSPRPACTPRRKPHQDGVAAIEFGLVAMVFFLIVFGIIEFARAMYMFNTLPEVTRRVAHAAAGISFADGEALDLARKRAVFNETKGTLLLGDPITYQNIRIEYLYLPARTSELQPIPAGAMPHCPTQNRINCANDPNGTSCIRAVKASICNAGGNGDACTAVTYRPLIPLIPLPLKLPMSLTIVGADTLGYRAGDAPCT
jgi:hypothetical protein